MIVCNRDVDITLMKTGCLGVSGDLIQVIDDTVTDKDGIEHLDQTL